MNNIDKVILVLSGLLILTVVINIFLLIKYSPSIEMIEIPAQILRG